MRREYKRGFVGVGLKVPQASHGYFFNASTVCRFFWC